MSIEEYTCFEAIASTLHSVCGRIPLQGVVFSEFKQDFGNEIVEGLLDLKNSYGRRGAEIALPPQLKDRFPRSSDSTLFGP